MNSNCPTPDDLLTTLDYALGDLSPGAMAEFEERLQCEPGLCEALADLVLLQTALQSSPLISGDAADSHSARPNQLPARRNSATLADWSRAPRWSAAVAVALACSLTWWSIVHQTDAQREAVVQSATVEQHSAAARMAALETLQTWRALSVEQEFPLVLNDDTDSSGGDWAIESDVPQWMFAAVSAESQLRDELPDSAEGTL